ncbi:MAG TPA: zf-HC2 domain-containing protein [Armatimonadota bacterium]
MNCRDIKRYSSAYLDGELSPAQRDAFFAHLQECSGCCDLVGEASYREAAFAVALKHRMAAPSAIRYNVLSALSREAARPVAIPIWRRAALRPAATMAAVLALAGTGWRTFTSSYEPLAPMAETQAQPNRPKLAAASKPAPRIAMRASVSPVRPEPRYSQPAPPPATVHRAAGPAAKPAIQPPVQPAPSPAVMPHEDPIGVVTYISSPDDVLNGRFLARRDGRGLWADAPSDLRLRTHLQSADETVVTITLRDGTVVKANQRTEWVIQRSPTKEDPAWGIRLVRGELWVRSPGVVKVESAGVVAEADPGEFSVRSLDGDDATVLVASGAVKFHNLLGSSSVAAGQAGVTQAGEAPGDAFSVDDPKSQMDWAYTPAPAYKPLE